MQHRAPSAYPHPDPQAGGRLFQFNHLSACPFFKSLLAFARDAPLRVVLRVQKYTMEQVKLLLRVASSHVVLDFVHPHDSELTWIAREYTQGRLMCKVWITSRPLDRAFAQEVSKLSFSSFETRVTRKTLDVKLCVHRTPAHECRLCTEGWMCINCGAFATPNQPHRYVYFNRLHGTEVCRWTCGTRETWLGVTRDPESTRGKPKILPAQYDAQRRMKARVERRLTCSRKRKRAYWLVLLHSTRGQARSFRS